MKKFGSLFSMICVMHVVAALGLVGYLVATKRLDKEKSAAILDLLRHQGTPDKLREQLYDIIEPTTATASAPASSLAHTTHTQESILAATAVDRIDVTRQAIEQERLKLEAEAQELRHRQALLAQLQVDVQAKLKKVETDKAAFEAQTQTVVDKAQQENFARTLALYDELKPKQIKEIFSTMGVDLVAQYLAAMAPDRAGKIISEFKTPDEKQFITGVLERLRSGGTTSAVQAEQSGGSASAATNVPTARMQ